MIEFCKSQFARHGIPDIVISDNGPQFSSEKFRQFASCYKFEHRTSSPYYPQSNGKAEKAVQTVKNLLRKAQVDGQDYHLALLDLRKTPTDHGSPAQRLMGRRTKTLLPTTKKLLLPKTINPSAVKKGLLHQQARQKHYYDRHSKPLSQLGMGDKVRFRKGASWVPAVITRDAELPRSYVIITPDGSSYQRNRRDLRPDFTTSVFEEDESDDDDPPPLIEDGEGENQTPIANSDQTSAASAAAPVDPLEQLPDHTAMLTRIHCDSKLVKKGDVTMNLRPLLGPYLPKIFQIKKKKKFIHVFSARPSFSAKRQ